MNKTSWNALSKQCIDAMHRATDASLECDPGPDAMANVRLDDIAALKDEIYALAAKARSNEIDAERYRWLRDHGNNGQWAICEWSNDDDRYIKDDRAPSVVDAAIDSARTKDKPATKFVNVQIPIFTDDTGLPTCAQNFDDGKVCPWYYDMRMGTIEMCHHGQKSLHRRDGKRGTHTGSLIPHDGCPIHGPKGEQK